MHGSSGSRQRHRWEHEYEKPNHDEAGIRRLTPTPANRMELRLLIRWDSIGELYDHHLARVGQRCLGKCADRPVAQPGSYLARLVILKLSEHCRGG